MSIGIITGTGAQRLPGLEPGGEREIQTPWGSVALTAGELAGQDVLHLARHGEGHARLSNHVEFRANVWALREAGARAVVGCSTCGAVDPSLAPGTLVVFDDLHFLTNRLPGGELCTYFTEVGGAGRGHWILGEPFSRSVRGALSDASRQLSRQTRTAGCYGHVDGPRFNTRAEIRGLAAVGVSAVSQTGGPETVLCGELELPYALVGFVSDHANGVRSDEPTSPAELARRLAESAAAFAELLTAALPRLAQGTPATAGSVYRF